MPWWPPPGKRTNVYAAAFPKGTHRRCGKEAGETCPVERWFGTLRARTSRLVRRTYSFSKDAENHLDAVHLFIATYNLALATKSNGQLSAAPKNAVIG